MENNSKCSIDKLKDWFGTTVCPDDGTPPKFQDNQEVIINNILDGNDVIAVMPTGSGKSLCYQYAAMQYHLIGKGLSIVVSPLTALMKSQLESLSKTKIPAAMISYLDCTDINTPNKKPASNKHEILARAKKGEYALLYVSSERLLSRSFIYQVQDNDIKISMLVVDEAHLVSEWGFQFRESYLGIPQFVRQLKHRPQISAFTATASLQDQQCIQHLLDMNTGKRKGHKTYSLPADKIKYERPNLDLAVREIPAKHQWDLPEISADLDLSTKNISDILDEFIRDLLATQSNSIHGLISKKEWSDQTASVELHLDIQKNSEEQYIFKKTKDSVFCRKEIEILNFLSKEENSSKDGIIFFNTIEDLNKFESFLKNSKTAREKYKGCVYKFYSTVQDDETQESRDEDNKNALANFIKDKKETEVPEKGRLMLATSAFGMGIDISGIGFVLHFEPPMDIETYYQEVGRGGHNSMDPCSCIMYYSYINLRKLRSYIESWRKPMQTVFPRICTPMSSGYLDLDMLKSYLQGRRLDAMEDLLKNEGSQSSSESIMEYISNYFKQSDEITYTKTKTGTEKPDKKIKNPVEYYLKSQGFEKWAATFLEGLKVFLNELKKDMGIEVDQQEWNTAMSSQNSELILGTAEKELKKEPPDVEKWEQNMADKLPSLQRQKNWMYYNDTLLAKNIRKGDYNKTYRNNTWGRLKISETPVTDNDSPGKITWAPLYTYYCIKSSKSGAQLTWFDMIVADAVYTLWMQGEKRIHIRDILDILTGDVGRSKKYDSRFTVCREIKSSLDRMYNYIKICFPTDGYGNPIFTFEEGIVPRKDIKNEQFKEFLPCKPVKTENDNKKSGVNPEVYEISDSPLLFDYAEHLHQISTLTADMLHVTDSDGNILESSLSDFKKVKINVYIAMRVNTSKKVAAHQEDLTNPYYKSNLLNNLKHIKVFRTKKSSKAVYLSELLQLDPRDKKSEQSIKDYINKVIKYESYIKGE